MKQLGDKLHSAIVLGQHIAEHVVLVEGSALRVYKGCNGGIEA
jgi:hypothetical protein